MITTSISLTEEEETALRVMAEESGKTPDELVREVVEQFLAEHKLEYRRALRRQAAGMWRDRTDLPDFASLRREFDRQND
ncbi:MAG: CopG family transcriptional regulator [Anaerolineae bacterium]